MPAPLPKANPRGRDPGELGARLSEWLGSLIDGGPPAVSIEPTSDATGISSETILFDMAPTDGRPSERLVARMEPDDPVPVFPSYDMELQFRCLEVVQEHTSVPVPRPRWYEPDESVLGAPFFVMDRVEGRVPPDLPPYTFEGWLRDATPADQARLWMSSIDVLAGIHTLNPRDHDLSFLERGGTGDDDIDKYLDRERAYFQWAADVERYPTIAAAFEWLVENRPASPGPSVMNWGDARIGNIMFRDFEPVGVFDWELAALGPREADVGWSLFLHTFFMEVAEMLDIDPGIEFPDRDETIAYYEKTTGVTLRDMEWYEAFAGYRFAAIITRTDARTIASGESEAPDDPESTIHPLPLLRRITGI
ncbi:MAG: phosphotransferase family protein [Acidimicrobiia bacterium]|nr:phosphotransferase family protein [Acidimicrobiia bacterium]